VDETEQVRRAQGGDEIAWGLLVRQHQEAIFRLAFLLLHDADDAQDVTQETLIRAYHALDRFDSARPLRPWLLEITRNQCYNWSRALRRRWAAWQRWGRAVPNDSAYTSARSTAQTSADPTEAVIHELAQQWQANALWDAVRRLSVKDQEVVYLRCFLELPVEETAQALNVAPGTVKSRLWRALERLRHIVEEDFPVLAEEITE
jgi:RNA polymerase sigma-70 factor (ECF subfamily)